MPNPFFRGKSLFISTGTRMSPAAFTCNQWIEDQDSLVPVIITAAKNPLLGEILILSPLFFVPRRVEQTVYML